MEKLPKIKSITKKLVVALLGGFLLLFLAFHMCANLFALANDGGSAYSAFCHFMGTNVIVKVFELVLMAAVLFHILITILLWFQNRKARGTVRYHVASKTKTAMGSKITIWTGVLILVFLCVHFWGFYFVKLNITHPEGHTYMAKTEDVMAGQEKIYDYFENEIMPQVEELVPADVLQSNLLVNFYLQGVSQGDNAAEVLAEIQGSCYDMGMMYGMDTASIDLQLAQLAQLKDNLDQVVPLIKKADQFTSILKMDDSGSEWVKGLTREQRDIFKQAGIEVEPDFYHNVRYMFSKEADANNKSGIISVVLYLFFFVVLWFHLRHALEACFQTLGLTNYKYHRAIEVIGIAYAWIICLGFAALPIYLYFIL